MRWTQIGRMHFKVATPQFDEAPRFQNRELAPMACRYAGFGRRLQATVEVWRICGRFM